MPCLSATFDPNVGPIVNVGFSRLGDPAHSNVRMNLCPLLVDTGADNTCVASNVVENMGIRPISKRLVQGATGASELNLYVC